MDDWLPVTLAVTSTLGRALLAAACMGIVATAGAILRIHSAQYELTAHRASLFAGASFIVTLVAFGAALLVGSAA